MQEDPVLAPHITQIQSALISPHPCCLLHETRRADAPAFERPKTALARCDAHAERLLRARGVRARVWGVLGAHVVRFDLNGPDPQTRPSRLRSAFWRAGAAPAARRVVLMGHTGRKGHGPAPAGARRARRPTGGWFLPWIRTRAPGAAPQLAPSVPSVPGMVHLGCSGHGGGTRARSDRASRPVGSRSGTRPRRRREVPPGISPPACPPCPAWAT